MADPDRQWVKQLDANRKLARNRLAADVSDAKQDLHPRNLALRWVSEQKRRATQVATASAQTIRKNAPLIGLASAAILLFTARKPISELYHKLRNRAPESEE